MTGAGASEADEATLAFYGKNAPSYAVRNISDRQRAYVDILSARLAPGAEILDFGCGGGWAAIEFQHRGFDVHAIDGCPELAAIASASLKRPVRVLRFEAFGDVEAYDGIFANGTLLHLRKYALVGTLARISTALRPNGVLFASFKKGEGEERDRLGRFYSFYGEPELEALLHRVPGLDFQSIHGFTGVDYAGAGRDQELSRRRGSVALRRRRRQNAGHFSQRHR